MGLTDKCKHLISCKCNNRVGGALSTDNHLFIGSTRTSSFRSRCARNATAVARDITQLHPATRRDESLTAQGFERELVPLRSCEHAGEGVRDVSVARHECGLFQCPDCVPRDQITGEKIAPKKFRKKSEIDAPSPSPRRNRDRLTLPPKWGCTGDLVGQHPPLTRHERQRYELLSTWSSSRTKGLR